MSPDDFALLEPYLVQVELPLRQIVGRSNSVITDLYFPVSGIVSIMTGNLSLPVEVGLIGREGLVGAVPVVLGIDRTPFDAIVQVPGVSLQIETRRFLRALEVSPALKQQILSYICVIIVETSQNAFACAAHSIEARLSRLLLMFHDRVPGDSFSVTHEGLATMLGVRRAGVTEALHVLEGNHSIKAQRGLVFINDPAALRVAAGDSYGLAEAEYSRLFGNAS